MFKKNGQISTETVIVFIIVIILLVIVSIFLFGKRIDLIIKNLPYFKGSEKDEQIDINKDQISFCKTDEFFLGRFEKDENNKYFLINSFHRENKKTSLEWDLSDDKIKINLVEGRLSGGIKLDVGSNKAFNTKERRIIIDQDIFNIQKKPEVFSSIVYNEIEENEEYFKLLLVLNGAILRGLSGTNHICQKKVILNELEKKLNLIYWEVEEPKTIDLRGKTSTLLKEEDIFDRYYYGINLSSYIKRTTGTFEYLNKYGVNEIETKGIYFKPEAGTIFLFVVKRDKYERDYKAKIIGEIEKDGRVVLYCYYNKDLINNEEIGYYLEKGNLRLPDKNVPENSPYYDWHYPLKCNTTIIIDYSEIFAFLIKKINVDIERGIIDSQINNNKINQIPDITIK